MTCCALLLTTPSFFCYMIIMCNRITDLTLILNDYFQHGLTKDQLSVKKVVFNTFVQHEPALGGKTIAKSMLGQFL